MKIIVCLKEVYDTSLNLGYGEVSDTLLLKGLSARLNLHDIQALAEALKIKYQDPESEITLLSLGAERIENYLREGLAQGADKAIRIWEEGFQYLSTYQKARLLSGAISILEADLILTGAKSQDNASGLTGPLMAAWLKMPCIGEVVGFHADQRTKTATVTRNAGKGLRENLLVTLPAVLSISSGQENLSYASLDRMLDSLDAEIPVLSLADLGITPQEIKKDPTLIRRISFPRPRTRPAPLDSSLPAFYRILALLEGGMSKRRGQLLKGDTDALVDHLMELLISEEKKGKP
jgi:electron transfer flavoprotein beta subunit